MNAELSTAVSAPPRMESLDVFRGLTIAGMIVVNNPGNWSAVYAPLLHAEWHGLTPTDLIFPFFVFIVGVCIPLSLRKYTTPGTESGRPGQAVIVRILRRSLLLFFISLFILHGFPWTMEKLQTIRIPGVLQRIALCYFATSCLYLAMRARGQAITLAILLIGYCLLLSLTSAPGFPPGDLSREGSLPSWVDRTLLAGHTYKPDYDPEGILSTLPAIATCLSGLLAGQWLITSRTRPEIACGLFAFGTLSTAAGYLWSLTFPVNKALWTSSFVLVTTGAALLLLGLCYWLIDHLRIRTWSLPFRILGVNALTVFVLSGLMSRLLGYVRIRDESGADVSLAAWLYAQTVRDRLSPENASLAWACSMLVFWLVIAGLMSRFRLRIRV